MAEKEKQLRIKPFKEDKTSVWYGYRHYKLINQDVTLCGGGQPCEDSEVKVKAYFKRKKLL